jgi:ribosomal protein S27E
MGGSKMFASQSSRKVKCTKCGKEEVEKMYGTGFDGWQLMREIVNEKNEVAILCPNCMQILIGWLNGGNENGMDNSKLLGS